MKNKKDGWAYTTFDKVKAKHTQGPWWINKTNGSENEICSGPSGLDTESQSKIITVAIAHGPQGEWGKVGAEHEANARLIAAAPELLRVLKLAKNALANHPDAELWQGLESVIAKAEGK